MKQVSRNIQRKIKALNRRKMRIRKKVKGTSERPRMSVFLTSRHIYVQFIDDVNSKTMCSTSTLSADLKGDARSVSKESAAVVGKKAGEIAKTNNISKAVFDRAGRLFHGRLKAVAEGARESGLKV